MKKEYSLNTRELGALALVVGALFIIVFFLGVNVGEHHERTKRRETVQAPMKKVQEGKTAKAEKVPLTPPKVKKAKAIPAKKGVCVAKTKYYVQVGAFREVRGAQNWKGKLEEKGYKALLLPPGPRGFYRVLLGPYDSKEIALRVARRVDSTFKVRSSVVQGRHLP